jgi:hypothetical protein
VRAREVDTGVSEGAAGLADHENPLPFQLSPQRREATGVRGQCTTAESRRRAVAQWRQRAPPRSFKCAQWGGDALLLALLLPAETLTRRGLYRIGK